MSTVLVTGANGFIGRYVCREAASRGYRVVGTGLGAWVRSPAADWGVSLWKEADLSVAHLLTLAPSPDIVVHCAGAASVGLSVDNPVEDFRNTVATTVEVLEYLRTCAPGAALVYPSSGAVYGVTERLPATEDAPCAPVSPYASHKVMAEDLCRSYGRSYGIKSSVVRVFSAYGRELRKQLLWDACRRFSEGECSFGGTGTEGRDFVHVEDVARLMLLAAEKASAKTSLVNCATGLETAVSSVLGVLLESLGAKGVPSFTGICRPGNPERMVGDPSRARAWGWTPEWSWQDGVRDYAAWFKDVSR